MWLGGDPGGKKLADGKSALTPCGTTRLNDCFVAVALAKTCGDPPTESSSPRASRRRRTCATHPAAQPAPRASRTRRVARTSPSYAQPGLLRGLPYDKKYMEWVEVRYKTRGAGSRGGSIRMLAQERQDHLRGNGGGRCVSRRENPYGRGSHSEHPLRPQLRKLEGEQPLEWMPRISRVP